MICSAAGQLYGTGKHDHMMKMDIRTLAQGMCDHYELIIQAGASRKVNGGSHKQWAGKWLSGMTDHPAFQGLDKDEKDKKGNISVSPVGSYSSNVPYGLAETSPKHLFSQYETSTCN